jgi:CheY-like chemotaxis protein
VEDLPFILVVEDGDAVESIVEDALTEGGLAIAASGEKAVTLLTGSRSKFRALVNDVNPVRDRMNGWEAPSAPERSTRNFPSST